MSYHYEHFPLSRRLVVDAMRVGMKKRHVHALIEVDVTEARQRLRHQRQTTGAAWSFTAFLITCIGQAIQRYPHTHAYRDWWGRLVIFDEVDITTIIEIEFDGKKFPLSHVIRRVNQRDVASIHAEIRAIQQNPSDSIGSEGRQRGIKLFLLMPWVLRRWLYSYMAVRPHLFKRIAGTVVVTAVGMFGHGAGWGITYPIFTLGITVGGIAERPGVVQGHIEIREYLNLTLTVDHDIVDGAPAARFANELKTLIETAYGLEQLTSDQPSINLTC